MTQHPAILALLLASLTISAMMLYAGWYGRLILARWDLSSGSEIQLTLERRTYLISTILSYALLFQMLSLFLYIFTADNIHALFTGAMCAAGTLNVNGYGYPVLMLKLVNCVLAGVWLVINYADTKGYDYPLIKTKYFLLGMLTLLLLLETLLLFRFFSQLKGDVITSCCGSLFSSDRPGVAGEISGLPHHIMEPVFFAAMGATVICGLVFLWKGRGGGFFSVVSSLTFVIATASLISFIGPFFYELPTHHCPFCILQKEYGHIGYLIYVTLLGGVICGVGAGALAPFKNRHSLAQVIPILQRRLVMLTLSLYLLFTLLVAYRMLFSDFRLG